MSDDTVNFAFFPLITKKNSLIRKQIFNTRNVILEDKALKKRTSLSSLVIAEVIQISSLLLGKFADILDLSNPVMYL